MPKNRYSLIIIIFSLVVTLGLIVFTIVHERYLDAVAVSSIGPALTWFALGAWKSKDEQQGDVDDNDGI